MIIITLNCKVGDVVRITWADVGINHEYHPIGDIDNLISELKKDLTTTTYGEVLYIKDNEIAISYTRTADDARIIYLREELIESIEVLEPRKSL